MLTYSATEAPVAVLLSPLVYLGAYDSYAYMGIFVFAFDAFKAGINLGL